MWLAVTCALLITHSAYGFYCLNCKLCVNEAFRNEFIHCIKENALNTRKEPKCVSYVWGEDIKEKNTFRFQEVFKDESGFKEHTETNHFKKWEVFASKTGVWNQPPEVNFFNTIE